MNPSVTPLTMTNNVDMETLWHMEFNNLFLNFLQWNGHMWKLIPRVCYTEPFGAFTSKDSAKVRYLCKVKIVLNFLLVIIT